MTSSDDGSQQQPDCGDLTLLLQAYAAGNLDALNAVIERVYAELRQMAKRQLQGERRSALNEPTALIHETYLRLAGGQATWVNRRHFFAAAAEAMRRILVDQSRRRLALKRGGQQVGIPLEESMIAIDHADAEVLDIDAGLNALALADPDAAEIVKLRFFGGLRETEAAEALGISRANASRRWTYARAWLYDWLEGRDS